MGDVAVFATDRGHALTRGGEGVELSEQQLNFLNTLRFFGRRCRSKARTDLFEACAVLSGDKTIALNTFAETLVRCLSQALGALPVLYLPGEQSVSFDEAWLLQLANAIARNDQSSMDFLLRSRVHPHARRHTRYLMASIVERFDMI